MRSVTCSFVLKFIVIDSLCSYLRIYWLSVTSEHIMFDHDGEHTQKFNVNRNYELSAVTPILYCLISMTCLSTWRTTASLIYIPMDMESLFVVGLRHRLWDSLCDIMTVYLRMT